MKKQKEQNQPIEEENNMDFLTIKKISKEEIEETKKQIKKRINKIKAIFVDKESAEKFEYLIERISFLIVHCKSLEHYINENGFQEMYIHGKGQFGYKESIQSQVYFKSLKSLNPLIKQLREIMKEQDKNLTDEDIDKAIGI
jgi:hypothetical protein